jgi:hypothetical protein
VVAEFDGLAKSAETGSMTAGGGGFASDGKRPDAAEALNTVPDRTLRMMLAEWKRWRARVVTAPTMRMRQERFDEATAFIHAIEDELALRVPGEQLRRQRCAAAKVAEIAAPACVPLADYRQAQTDLERIKRRRHR